ncbi:hypothetical protein Lal_00027272 [Lupinus albus]|nr:hypothetical protein Lal_00027272 [Lupinus albus]
MVIALLVHWSDRLVIPISIVASKSTFSAGGRVIDKYHSKLNEESIEALICGGNWLRSKYLVEKKEKEREIEEDQKEIYLKN